MLIFLCYWRPMLLLIQKIPKTQNVGYGKYVDLKWVITCCSFFFPNECIKLEEECRGDFCFNSKLNFRDNHMLGEKKEEKKGKKKKRKGIVSKIFLHVGSSPLLLHWLHVKIQTDPPHGKPCDISSIEKARLWIDSLTTTPKKDFCFF